MQTLAQWLRLAQRMMWFWRTHHIVLGAMISLSFCTAAWLNHKLRFFHLACISMKNSSDGFQNSLGYGPACSHHMWSGILVHPLISFTNIAPLKQYRHEGVGLQLSQWTDIESLAACWWKLLGCPDSLINIQKSHFTGLCQVSWEVDGLTPEPFSAWGWWSGSLHCLCDVPMNLSGSPFVVTSLCHFEWMLAFLCVRWMTDTFTEQTKTDRCPWYACMDPGMVERRVNQYIYIEG